VGDLPTQQRTAVEDEVVCESGRVVGDEISAVAESHAARADRVGAPEHECGGAADRCGGNRRQCYRAGVVRSVAGGVGQQQRLVLTGDGETAAAGQPTMECCGAACAEVPSLSAKERGGDAAGDICASAGLTRSVDAAGDR